MQNGTVVAVSWERGMIIVRIDGGDCAVFELLDGIVLAEGDRVRGDLEALGGEELQHVGQRCGFNVFGQTGPSSLSACERILGI